MLKQNGNHVSRHRGSITGNYVLRSHTTVTAKENPRETGGFLHSQELRGAFLVHISNNHPTSMYFPTFHNGGTMVWGGVLRLQASDGSFLWASRFTASGVGRPRASSRATRS